MANVVYPKAKKAFLDGNVNLLSNTISVQAYEEDLEYDPDDEFLSHLSGTAVGSAVNITSKDTTDGLFTGTVGPFTLPSGFIVTTFIIYVNTGSAGTSRLLAWIDTMGDTSPILIPTSGSVVNVNWVDPFFSIGG